MKIHNKINKLLIILYIVTTIDFIMGMLGAWTGNEIVINIGASVFCLNIVLLMVLREYVKELEKKTKDYE